MDTVTNIQNIANALGWTLVHFLWQGILIFLAYWLVTRLFCKNRINLHYWIGMFFMVLCLIVPSYEFISQLNTTTTRGVLHEIRIQIESLGDNGILSTKDMVVTLIQMSIPYVVIIWGFSVLLISSHLFKSWLALIKLSREKSDPIPEYLSNRFKQAIKQLKLRLKPLVVISNKIDIAATFGYFKPVVLIPASMIAKLPQEQMEAILLHELCHIKRADFLHNIIQLLIETLFFYHPLTKWISRDIRKVREQCCDKLVLELGASPMVYAKALTNIAMIQNYMTNPHLQIAANDGELFERIKFLMLKKQRKAPSLTVLSVLAISIVFMVATNNLINTNSNISIVYDSTTVENEPYQTNIKKPNYSIIDALTGLSINNKSSNKDETINNKALKVVTNPEPVKPLQPTDKQNISFENKSETLIENELIVDNFSNRPTTSESSVINNNVAFNNQKDIVDNNPIDISNSPSISNYPKLIKMVNPSYNKLARSRGIEGTVIISFNIDNNGRVKNINVDKSSPLKLLDGNARQALRKWRFDPNSINRNILNNRYQQIFSFNLNEIGNCIDGDTGSRLAKAKICK